MRCSLRLDDQYLYVVGCLKVLKDCGTFLGANAPVYNLTGYAFFIQMLLDRLNGMLEVRKDQGLMAALPNDLNCFT